MEDKDRGRLRAIRVMQIQTGETYDYCARAVDAAAMEAQQLILEAGRKSEEDGEKGTDGA